MSSKPPNWNKVKFFFAHRVNQGNLVEQLEVIDQLVLQAPGVGHQAQEDFRVLAAGLLDDFPDFPNHWFRVNIEKLFILCFSFYVLKQVYFLQQTLRSIYENFYVFSCLD